MKFTKDELREILKKIIIICSGIVFYYIIFNFHYLRETFYTLLGYARPIIYGFIIAFVVNMITIQYQKLFYKVFKVKNKKLVKYITIILAFVTLIIVFTFIISVVLPQFINSVITLLYQLPSLIEKTIFKLQEISYFNNIADEVQTFINEIQMSNIVDGLIALIRRDGGSMFTGTLSIVGQIFSSFFEGFLALSLSAYIVLSKDDLKRNSKKIVYSVFSERMSDKIVRLLTLLYTNFYNFFTGQSLEALFLGVMAFIGTTVIGAPYSLMLGVMAGLLNFIPYLGAVTGAILATTLIAINDPAKGLIYMIYILIVQQIDGNYIYPRLVGSKMGIPAFWIIISLTLGGSMMGVIGMVIFIPLISTIYMLAKEFSNKKLKEKKINIDEK